MDGIQRVTIDGDDEAKKIIDLIENTCAKLARRERRQFADIDIFERAFDGSRRDSAILRRFNAYLRAVTSCPDEVIAYCQTTLLEAE